MTNLLPYKVHYFESVDQAKQTLPELISRQWYSSRLAKTITHLNRAIKVAPYEYFLEEFYNEVELYASGQDVAYYCTPPIVFQWIDKNAEPYNKLAHHYLPVQFTRDEQLHNERALIPFVFMDQYTPDLLVFWGRSLEFKHYQSIGLTWVGKGLFNPLVATRDKMALKRFIRNAKEVATVNYITDDQELRDKLTKVYTPLAKEYWASQDIYAAISDNLEVLRGSTGGSYPPIRLVGIEVVQKDGAKGIGIFTHCEPNQLYWDYSRRSIGDNIGNNILLEAINYASLHRLDWLNLGVGYYKWKDNWAKGNGRWNPGLRFTNGHSPALKIAEAMFRVKGEPLAKGFNKERTVA